jgi:hypothetical protein
MYLAGGHVFAGTHAGIYESTDFASNWALRNETAGWGQVAVCMYVCMYVQVV